MSSAKYRWKYIRLIPNITQESTYGGVVREYIEGDELWAYLEYLKPYEKLLTRDGNQVVGRDQARMHIHNFPDVTDRDVLLEKMTGDIWHVEGESEWGDNETIVMVWRGERGEQDK